MSKVKNIFENTDCISEETLLKYISDKLPTREKHEVERHLADCEMCSDAVEGLEMIVDKNRISRITSELNQKIQTRIATNGAKKEVKVIFLQQYRTQLAVAASVVVLLGLILFFRNSISMKELDPATSEKIFADKFEPPASDLDKEEVTGKEQTASEVGAVANVTVPPPPASIVLRDVAEEKAVAAEEPSFSALENAQGAKDIPQEKSEALAQKDAQLKRAMKDEEKEGVFYWRNKNAETEKGKSAAKPEGTVRNEEDGTSKDELAQVIVTKESSKSQNENNLEFLKEKDKKDEGEKQVATTTAPKSPEIAATSRTSAVAANQPVADQTALAGKQENKKTADDRSCADTSKLRELSGEVNILAYQTTTKKYKETESKSKGKKETPPQKVSGGYFDQQSGNGVPVTESSTIKIETQAVDQNGKMADSISAGIVTLGSSMSVSETALGDDAMVKYDKQDYAGAVNGFEQALKENPNDEKAIFYSAVSYLSLGQTDKALANFNKILLNKNSKYYDDAQWYSSLAYIKNNDIKNARSNLIQIQNNEKSRYQKQADETLEQIKK